MNRLLFLSGKQGVASQDVNTVITGQFDPRPHCIATLATWRSKKRRQSVRSVTWHFVLVSDVKIITPNPRCNVGLTGDARFQNQAPALPAVM